MGALSDQLQRDYPAAVKAQNRRRIDTIRLIKADLEKLAIEKKTQDLSDEDVMQILRKQVKQRREMLEAARASGRQEIIAQTTEELKILEGYLPQPLGREGLQALIEEAITSVGPQQGPIMKFVMGKAAGAADGKLVSQLVAERLGRPPKAGA